jgi:hypothetical protein
MRNYELLIKRFVASFGIFDELSTWKDLDPIAWELRTGKTDELGRSKWRPAKVITDNSALEPLYAKLPAAFLRCTSNLYSPLDGLR